MCLAQGPHRIDTGEAQTCGLSVSSQALYHWATALPMQLIWRVTDKKGFDYDQIASYKVTWSGSTIFVIEIIP